MSDAIGAGRCCGSVGSVGLAEHRQVAVARACADAGNPSLHPTFEIARMMGTSIEQIEKTYGHLLPDALERGRAALEAFDARIEDSAAERPVGR